MSSDPNQTCQNREIGPISVNLESSSYKIKQPFKFEKIWTYRKDFANLIKQAWRYDPPGSQMLKLIKKTQLLKYKAKGWNRKTFGNIFTKPVGILISGIAVVALFNILTLFGVPSGTWQNVSLGVVVILCGILSHLNHKGVVK